MSEGSNLGESPKTLETEFTPLEPKGNIIQTELQKTEGDIIDFRYNQSRVLLWLNKWFLLIVIKYRFKTYERRFSIPMQRRLPKP